MTPPATLVPDRADDREDEQAERGGFVYEALTEEECYLFAILQDGSGLDLAEFCFVDETQEDACFRAYPMQWPWWRCMDPRQVEQGGRDTGKSMSIQARAGVHPFKNPGAEMAITGPEKAHLKRVTTRIEQRFLSIRLLEEMLIGGRSQINAWPFLMRFKNGGQIVGAIPQKSGLGFKGLHSIWLETDEAQDLSDQAWSEIRETLRQHLEGAQWRVHGVSKGIPDEFRRITTKPELGWKVHRITQYHKPTFTAEERERKIRDYGGTKESPEYRRQVLGFHGDSTNLVFDLAKLMQGVDSNEGSDYNVHEYYKKTIRYDQVQEVARERGIPPEDYHLIIKEMLDLPLQHKEKYKVFWSGMDCGIVQDPSAILIFAEYEVKADERRRDAAAGIAVPAQGVTRLKLLARIELLRIPVPDQAQALIHIIDFYRPRVHAMDKMQPVSEPVLTPGGWVPIGDLKVGDEVIGSDGAPTKVTGVYPQQDTRVMKVTCTDGSWARCGPEHLWTAKHARREAPETLTTEALALLVNGPGPNRWTIPMLSAPAQTQSATPLPLDPYLLGALLGDGNLRQHSTRFSSVDPEILFEVESRLPEGHVLKHTDRCNYYVQATGSLDVRNAKGQFEDCNVVLAHLKALGLAGKRAHEKAVPEVYLNAGPEERLLLLQGLMDTDGWVTVQGNSSHIGIRSSSEQLIRDTVRLVESLGGSARYRPHATSCNGKPGRTGYRAAISMPAALNPFRLPRKRDAVLPRRRNHMKRTIASIVPDGEEESVCIRVAAADQLYVTRHHLLTHNTGNGTGILQVLQQQARVSRLMRVDADADDNQFIDQELAEKALVTIKGYDFNSKVVVEIDEAAAAELPPGKTNKEIAEAVGIKKQVKTHATDCMRLLVDTNRYLLPFDDNLIRQLTGQTWVYMQSQTDKHPPRRFSEGQFHAFDGARMAALGMFMQPIETVLNAPPPAQEPVYEIFGGDY